MPGTRRFHRLAFAAALALSGCGGSSQPTARQLTDFVSSVQTGDGTVTASRQAGSPPAANGGPAVTATAAGTSSAAVVSGGSTTVSLRAASPFQTAYLTVIDDPLDGYYKLDFPAPTTDTTVTIKLGSSIPVGNFQTVFSVALGTSVGAPSSIADTNKTPTSVAVTGTAPTLGGGTQQFTATATFSDNTTQDVTSSATWASSAAGVATVSSAGAVSAVAAGTASITAAYGSISGSKSITITAQTGSTFTVNGTVTDGATGGVLPGVGITIGSQSTTTDSGGNYAISGLSAGSIIVVASAAGYQPDQSTVTISSDTRVNFSLTRLVASASISAPGSCTAGDTTSNCTWTGSSMNIASPVYSWSFGNDKNANTVTASGQSASPVFSCAFVGIPNTSFTVNATLTATGTGGPKTATSSTPVTRSPPCL